MRKFLVFITLVIICISAAVIILPWQSLLTSQIQSVLEDRGFEHAQINVSKMSFNGISLVDFSLGTKGSPTFDSITISYSFLNLKKRVFDNIIIEGAEILIRKSDKGWAIDGLENFSNYKNHTGDISIDILTNKVLSFPFNTIEIRNSTIQIIDGSWDLTLPINIKYEKDENINATYQFKNSQFSKDKIKANINNVTGILIWDKSERVWQGSWKISDIDIDGLAENIPSLSGDGSVKAAGKNLSIGGTFATLDKLYELKFKHSHSFDKNINSALNIILATLPWKEGRLRIANALIPLDPKQSIAFNLEIERVSVDELLGAVTGKKISATGKVSGIIPIVIAPDGSLTFKKGTLKAEGPGTIIMPPDTIPGNNEKIALVRKILSDLNYSALSIDMNSNNDNDLGISLSIEGRNPDVYDGRIVKLNVNLTGEVLDFIQQNIMLLKNPENLWKQDTP